MGNARSARVRILSGAYKKAPLSFDRDAEFAARYHSISQPKLRPHRHAVRSGFTGGRMPSPFLRRELRPRLHNLRPSFQSQSGIKKIRAQPSGGCSGASSPTAFACLAPPGSSLLPGRRLLLPISAFHVFYGSTELFSIQVINLINLIDLFCSFPATFSGSVPTLPSYSPGSRKR